ncbi:MAG: hypothetical protein ACE5G9_12160 [Nitrospinales bacterium]
MRKEKYQAVSIRWGNDPCWTGQMVFSGDLDSAKTGHFRVGWRPEKKGIEIYNFVVVCAHKNLGNKGSYHNGGSSWGQFKAIERMLKRKFG